MQIVVGPVLTRKGGYAFDCWTPEQGLSPGYTYGRVEDAHYARSQGYSEGFLAGLGAPQASASSRKAACQFWATMSRHN
jgi:hypothetical protein